MLQGARGRKSMLAEMPGQRPPGGKAAGAGDTIERPDLEIVDRHQQCRDHASTLLTRFPQRGQHQALQLLMSPH